MHNHFGENSFFKEIDVENSQDETWQVEYSLETSASSEVLWRIWSDVPGWKQWNAGVEEIKIEGLFAAGTEFVMTPPGQDPLRTRLVEVRQNECFVDETRVEDLVVFVAHRLERLMSGRTRVTYALEAVGPGSAEIGLAVSADFPEVLAALVTLAESQSVR